jgi:hypothetical protein
VIWRKLSFGTQSATGSRFVETMLTVIETCRQQHRNAFAFVTAAVESHLAHQSAIPGVGLIWDRGQPTGSKWGGVTADLLARS